MIVQTAHQIYHDLAKGFIKPTETFVKHIDVVPLLDKIQSLELLLEELQEQS